MKRFVSILLTALLLFALAAPAAADEAAAAAPLTVRLYISGGNTMEMTLGETEELALQLLDANGKPVEGALVGVRSEDRFWGAGATDEYGVAVIYLTPTEIGTFALSVWSEALNAENGKSYSAGSTSLTLTVSRASQQNISLLMPFRDVTESNPYWGDITYCYYKGLMNGTGDDLFDPDGTATRAMIATVLWRMSDEVCVNYAMAFADVPAESWYTEAVRWAASKKIVTGYSDTAFGPEDPITREQLAAILYRYVLSEGRTVGAAFSISGFDDADAVSAYAADAMRWARSIGLLTFENNLLRPGENATRGEIAHALHILTVTYQNRNDR